MITRGNALTLSCLGFLSGVAWASLFTVGIWEVSLCFLLVGSFLFLGAVCGNINSFKNYLIIVILVFTFALGLMRFFRDNTQTDLLLTQADGHFSRIEGLVLEEPVQRLDNTAIHLSAEFLYWGTEKMPVSGKILITSERSYGIGYGDRLLVEGKLSTPKSFVTDTGRSFDYPSYLEAKEIYFTMYYPKLTVLASGEGNWFREKLFFLKNKFLEAIQRVLPEPESTLLSGLLMGAQRPLPDSVADNFRTAGLSHIVVLSGYNITLVSDLFMRALSFVPLLPRLIGGGLGITLFVLMVGGGMAAIRAAIMAVLVLVARGTGRTYEAGRALLLSGTLMVALDPKILLGDVSFQLSFLATAGLIYGSPILERALSNWPDMHGLKSLTISTLSAQIFVLPLILYQSGLLSLVALPANLAVLPSVPIAMLTGAILGVLALFNTGLGSFFSFISYLPLHYEIKVASFFATLPSSHFIVPEFSPYILCVVYMLGGLGVYLFHRRASLSNSVAQISLPPQTNSDS